MSLEAVGPAVVVGASEDMANKDYMVFAHLFSALAVPAQMDVRVEELHAGVDDGEEEEGVVVVEAEF